jgi:type 1 glutamine amidotransferase
MMMEGPADEGQPWYSGQPRTALADLGATGQGIVVLHHALLAYPQWDFWSELCGIPERKFGFYHAETVTSDFVAPDHPILRGLAPWTMVDETYTMDSAGTDSEILITYDHPRSMKTIAWTRRFRQSPVFCYEAGHDNETWPDRNFQEVLRRGVLWAGGRLE